MFLEGGTGLLGNQFVELKSNLLGGVRFPAHLDHWHHWIKLRVQFEVIRYAYACMPGNRYVTPKNVNITTANPKIAKYAARRPRQPRVIRI